MSHEDYMRIAIKTAKEAEEDGGLAIGAIIIKSEDVIAKGKSLVWPQKVPSSHGESNCIRTACKKLDSLDLSECVMYTTLEPCGMCLSCAAWASIPEIYFGAYRSDAEGNNYEICNWNAEKAARNMNTFNGGYMKVVGGISRDECVPLMVGYKDWMKQ